MPGDTDPADTEAPDTDAVDTDTDPGDDTDPPGPDDDGDGYASLADGGDDCDDTDPAVHPGHLDWMNDGVDSDCDGADGAGRSLADVAVRIDGDPSEEAWVGRTVEVCDLDADGFDDLVIAAPFAGAYAGRVGVFYGANHAAWGPSTDFATADTLLQGTGYLFGAEARCGDVDGDGNLDLVVTRAEYNSGGVERSDLGVLLFYGDGEPFGPTLDDTDGVELSFDLSGPDDFVSHRPIAVGDLDGDRADEIVVNMTISSSDSGFSEIWIVPGARYDAGVPLDTVLSARLTTDDVNTVSALAVVEDVDGDGVHDLLVGEEDVEVAGEEAGLVSFVARPSTGLLADQAAGSLQGQDAWHYGYAAVVADFDGDGAADAAVAAPLDATGGEAGGAILLHGDVAADLTGARVSASSAVDGRIYGDHESTFGYRLWPVGDVDGDGSGELLTAEFGPDEVTGDFQGRIWLVRAAVEGDVLDDAAGLQWWSYEDVNDRAGSALGAGDIDGDGTDDLVVGAYGHGGGRVYVELSSSWVR